jgi:hypothetical protein
MSRRKEGESRDIKTWGRSRSRKDEQRVVSMRMVVSRVVDAIRWWVVNISENKVSKGSTQFLGTGFGGSDTEGREEVDTEGEDVSEVTGWTGWCDGVRDWGWIWWTRLMVFNACLYASIRARQPPEKVWIAERKRTISVWKLKGLGADVRDFDSNTPNVPWSCTRSYIIFSMNHGCVILGTTSFKKTLMMTSRIMRRSASGW